MALVIVLPTTGFALLLMTVLALAAWEWAPLVGLTTTNGRLSYLASVVAAVMLTWWLIPPSWYLPLLLPVVAWWLLLTVTLFKLRHIQPISGGVEPKLALTGIGLLTASWLALILLDQQGNRWLVLFLMLLVWFADSAAYFAGRRWGRRKLAPVVSPGKTLAGVGGGVAIAVLWSGVLLIALSPAPVHAIALNALCIVTVLLSIVGDLYESWLKRRRSVKDAGTLLPGHGGMLDRVDSMIAAAPLFVVGFLLLEKYL
ncbi:phosphatidate cytidylyltransferase [Thiospirillum jenense]|uniref:Phosphatidate cytidylyltransferase n=2 Tax=Thiospirillum jenense TaxID=1653858 RepID=A0A839HBM0_9GAMM|nr:phosphatidate cytidylyltransferase [Thiospirillum jenense]